jgi:cytochrome c oxidase assembly protein subunit 15
VGIYVVALVIWLMIAEPRRWVKVLAWCALGFGALQGTLGGLRVILNESQIGILHGILAQSLLVLIAIIAVVTSPAFIAGRWSAGSSTPLRRALALALTITILAQLVIAATMRHAHAGLSIPDFPAAYGALLPDTSAAAMDAINAQRAAAGQPLTTPGLVWLQMAHRGVALVIALLVAALALRVDSARRMVRLLAAMVAAQIGLGAWTIWSDKAADVATAHMALGALTFVVSALLTFRFFTMRGAPAEEPLAFSAPPRYSRPPQDRIPSHT